MSRGPAKYVLDTQLFIQGFRDPAGNESLQRFHTLFAPFEYLSVIVAHELRSGVRHANDRRALERNVLAVFERTDRVVCPSPRAWQQSGDVLAAMVQAEGLELGRLSKAFGNDVLLALSCREAGCTLVTDNQRDFRRIRRFVQFAFVPAWPWPS